MVLELPEITKIYVRVSKQYGFKPPILKEIVFLRSKGFSNLEIAEETGVSRNTVSSYLEKLRGIEDEQMAELMSLIGLMMERHNKLFTSMLGEYSSERDRRSAGLQPGKTRGRMFSKQV